MKTSLRKPRLSFYLASGIISSLSFACSGKDLVYVDVPTASADAGIGDSGSTADGQGDTPGEAGTSGDSTSPSADSGQEHMSDAGTGTETSAPDADGTPPSEGGAFVGDPCPSTPVSINCSQTCNQTTLPCAQVSCQTLPMPAVEPLVISSYSQLPMIIRTPDLPGVSPECATACGGRSTSGAFEVAVRVSLPYAKNGFRIIAGSPYTIGHFDPYAPFCTGEQPISGCGSFLGTFYDFLIWTDDPNAPSRNIVIEETLPGQECP